MWYIFHQQIYIDIRLQMNFTKYRDYKSTLKGKKYINTPFLFSWIRS